MQGVGRRPGRARGRGAPLWAYLTALVLIPLMGVAVLTVVVAQSRRQEAASAARAESGVKAVTALDAARSGVDDEIVPILAVAVVDNPATAAALHITPEMLAAVRDQVLALEHSAQATTDTALARVHSGQPGSAVARRVEAALARLRSGGQRYQLNLGQIYLGYLDLSNELMTAERAAASDAGAHGVPARTLGAIRDVETVADLAQTASRQMPLFLGSMFDGGAEVMGSQLAWETAWQAYTDVRQQMDQLSQPKLRAAWEGIRDSSVVTAVDRVVAPGSSVTAPALSPAASAVPHRAEPTVLEDPAELAGLLSSGMARDAVFNRLVSSAADDVLGLAAADREQAGDRLHHTLELALGLLLASLLGAAWLGRSVARSLGLLADQATEISEGSLIEVEVAGPQEVRTVSTALGSAVAGLRRIQDQAQAVAKGDLANPLLHESLPGRLGQVVHASVQEIVTSMREREELQFQLAHQATHDPLTELPNRTQALALVTAALHRGRRTEQMTGLLFVDLDGFKGVNDRHGHASGDEVLCEVARRLRAAVRPGDTVCRLGGDEFVVLVEPVTRERDLVELAERLIAVVSEPIQVDGLDVRIGASVGVAVSCDGGADADALFAEADTAAYRAKRHGRGRAEVFDDDLRRQLSARADLEAAIATALTNEELQLHYQPVVDLASDRILGYEALVRWNRPGHGMVPPDQFIPVAEGSRLICELDRWVLHEATRQLAEWRAQVPAAPGEPEPTVAVNVSGRHLTDRRIVADVADALAASGLPPHLLIVEVTETVLIDDPVAIGRLAELRDMGVAVAIDDFGTGYTSIGQLRHMPVDTLKIDRSFIASTDAGHQELVALIIRAAHTFGLTVVAEGVEEPAQLDQLRADACDHAQGYLLYRPLAAPAAGALLLPQTTR